MEAQNPHDILKMLNRISMFSQLEKMTVKEIKEYLEKKGIIVGVFIFGKETGPFDKDMKIKEFMMKYGITEIECETIKLLAEGLTQKEIAERLGRTSHAIIKRCACIREKLGVNKTQDAVLKAKDEKAI